jgi:Xaa-Pro aminopeptidase
LSDYAHTWVVDADPTSHQRDLCRRGRDVVDATLAATLAGATARDLPAAAESAAGTRAWLPHLYLAHGTGTDSAEPPFVGTDLGDAFDESVVLAVGMVMVLEPVVWDDGRGGFRAEQIVAVTDDGWRSLSRLTWDGWE